MQPTKMQAVSFSEYGEPSVLKVDQMPVPEISADQILVEVYAAGINPFDAKIRRGYLQWFYPVAFPFIPGADFAGIVAACGDNVHKLKVGDKVWGLTTPMKNGSYAQYVVLSADAIGPMPQNLSFEAAASMPMGALTAWIALVSMTSIKQGDKVFVHAGAGGVGGYAIQIAKHFGAIVTTTCSTRNVEYCRSLGADVVIDYTEGDFAALVKDQDYALDLLGGEESLKTYQTMKRGGTILLVERGNKLEMENRERLKAEYGVNLSEVAFENDVAVLKAIHDAVEAGWLKPTWEETLPLAQAQLAHERIQSKRTRGKLVLGIKT
jgi:NADPH:quinone reductase-like Zn-dependent oxidoreductase